MWQVASSTRAWDAYCLSLLKVTISTLLVYLLAPLSGYCLTFYNRLRDFSMNYLPLTSVICFSLPMTIYHCMARTIFDKMFPDGMPFLSPATFDSLSRITKENKEIFA